VVTVIVVAVTAAVVIVVAVIDEVTVETVKSPCSDNTYIHRMYINMFMLTIQNITQNTKHKTYFTLCYVINYVYNIISCHVSI